MSPSQVIELARKHVTANSCAMISSAKLCLDDAESLFSKGREAEAKSRAINSLRYSVGILHDDYKKAVA